MWVLVGLSGAGERLGCGFLGAGRARLVDVLLLRVVGRLVDLLLAGGPAMQMGDAALGVTAAAAG
jgi:hypothetical protein